MRVIELENENKRERCGVRVLEWLNASPGALERRCRAVMRHVVVANAQGVVTCVWRFHDGIMRGIESSMARRGDLCTPCVRAPPVVLLGLPLFLRARVDRPVPRDRQTKMAKAAVYLSQSARSASFFSATALFFTDSPSFL